MAHSPSKRWENGVLVERAISTNAPAEPNESEGTTAKPYKTPTPTPQTAEERAQLREAAVKMVGEAENKAVKAKATKKK